jgi:hypothetical protein
VASESGRFHLAQLYAITENDVLLFGESRHKGQGSGLFYLKKNMKVCTLYIMKKCLDLVGE